MKVSLKYPLSCRLKKKFKLKITVLSKTEELLSNFKLPSQEYPKLGQKLAENRE